MSLFIFSIDVLCCCCCDDGDDDDDDGDGDDDGDMEGVGSDGDDDGGNGASLGNDEDGEDGDGEGGLLVDGLFCCFLGALDFGVNFLLLVDFGLFPPNKRPKKPFVIFLIERVKQEEKQEEKRTRLDFTATNLYTLQYNTMYYNNKFLLIYIDLRYTQKDV